MRNGVLHAFMLLCMCFSTMELVAQSLQVRGRVTSTVGSNPLPGVTVAILGQSISTSTNVSGEYSITISGSSATLVFSQVGRVSQQISVTSSGTYNVSLEEELSELDEVVVVGYGTQKKSLVTGAISSVKEEELKSVSNARIDQALQGRTAGVTVLPTSGQPGAGINIRIRGTGSNRSNQPLYVIDGVRAGGIEALDPSEVASIEVLKDAASAAIYGAEGANGVIIITTKTGKHNTSDISWSSQLVQQSVKNNFITMMNADQYQQYLQASNTPGSPSASDVTDPEGTNWLSEVINNAPQQRHTLTFSGGSEKSTYLLSGTYFTQEGIAGGPKSRFDRYNVRFNGDSKLRSWLTVGNRLSITQFKRRAISDNNEFGSILVSALVMDPTTPVVYANGSTLPSHVQAAMGGTTPNGDPIGPLLRTDPNGNLYGISNWLRGEYGNPLARIDMARGETVQNKIVGNVYAEVEPIENFKFTSRFGVDIASQQGHGWTPTFWSSSESLNSIATGWDNSDTWTSWQWENFATYQRAFNQHNLSVLGGVSAMKFMWHGMNGSYAGLFKEEDRFSYADFVPDDTDRIGSNANTRTLASFFGRISYDFAGRYLLNATVRRDGSSLFSSGYKWGTFPSVSAGWILSNESFYGAALSSILNYAKVRASWGQNGSLSAVGLGEWMNAVGSGHFYPDADGNLLNGAAPNNLAYPTLTWETSQQFDVGLDLAFLSNRLSVTMDYYKKSTMDLLTTGSAPFFAGAPLLTVNAGEVVNKGFEFEMNYRDKIGSDFNFEIGGNFTTLNNKVTRLDPNIPFIGGAGVGTGWTATAMTLNNPIWYFNGYKTDGIFQTPEEISQYIADNGLTGYAPNPGDPRVVDVNGDGQISNADMTMIGNPHPDFVYGARLSASYKGFDFLVLFQGQTGNDIMMGFNRTDRPTANKPAFFSTDAWTGPGSTNTWFAPNTSNNYIYNSDLMIFSGSFARIRQLQFGYTLGDNVLNTIRFKNARVYVSLDDFFTFTKYPGVDPEGGSNGGNSIGIDRGGYPIPRKAMVGLSFTF
ncbi:TonB-dependent receptor [Sphingobacterium olei]|uniref:TonB-dependent receptor n=1 Tax=Sphingobacterium olei TaxID=2571155 RepID=A0A4U0P6B7_9SPHI|nr:TonB-dependent receptor [Sphingobacterium olei]TJZ62272.1 TonB-dependent receptor [Sphingobacterium olei]